MKKTQRTATHMICLVLGLASVRLALPQNQENQAPPQKKVQQQPLQAGQNARPDIEQERKSAEQQAQQSLDKEAVAALEETMRASQAISENKTEEAIAALERATGKLDILLARNPTNALIPVSFEVEIIDAAPQDMDAIKTRARAVEYAVDDKAFPVARVLLEGLASEIRARTYNLPLITYPTALKEAARRLQSRDNQGARNVLVIALHTLVAVDRVTPLPILFARTEVEQAQALRATDKNAAQRHLETARRELERAKGLGYAGNDPEYASLNKSISNLEKQLKDNGDTEALFASLKQRLTAFFKRQSDTERRSIGGTGATTGMQKGQSTQGQNNQPQNTQSQTNK